MRQTFGEDADQERGGHGSSGGNPAPEAARGRTRRLRGMSAGEGNDARRPAQMIDLLQNPGVLAREPIGREHGVGLVDHSGGHVAKRGGERLAAACTAFAGAQMRLVERSDRVRETDLDQAIVGEVGAAHTADRSRASEVFIAPVSAPGRSSSLRSLRTARNRCTRTVASLRPSA